MGATVHAFCCVRVEGGQGGNVFVLFGKEVRPKTGSHLGALQPFNLSSRSSSVVLSCQNFTLVNTLNNTLVFFFLGNKFNYFVIHCLIFLIDARSSRSTAELQRVPETQV